MPESPLAMQNQWAQGRYTDGDVKKHVTFRQMAGSEHMERSHKIIEIGAMAVTRRVDHALKGNDGAILQKLDEVERYLTVECGECEDALRGCATIREAVKGKMRKSDEHEER